MPQSKYIRFMKFVAEYYLSRRGRPSVANYDITWRCNLRCRHCYFFKSSPGDRELNTHEWAEVFEKHRSEGITSAFLTGGEPSLRPDVIRAANRIFTNVVIVSNGIIPISPDIRRRIFISIDGCGEAHDRMRGVECFDRIARNVKGDRRVVITPTLAAANFDQIEPLVKLARDLGVDGIFFSTCTAAGPTEADPLLISGELLDHVIERMKRVIRSNRDILFMTEGMTELWRTKDFVKYCGFLRNEWISYYPDMSVKKPCVFGPNARCHTCGCIVPVYVGSVFRRDLRAIYMLDRLFPANYTRRADEVKDASGAKPP